MIPIVITIITVVVALCTLLYWIVKWDDPEYQEKRSAEYAKIEEKIEAAAKRKEAISVLKDEVEILSLSKKIKDLSEE